MPNGGAPANSPSPTGRDFVDKHIKPMSEDLEKKRALFMDDASFISEVCAVLLHTSPPHSFSSFWLPTAPAQVWGTRPTGNTFILRPQKLPSARRLHQSDGQHVQALCGRCPVSVQVREGRALAPGMDPEAELKTLRLRFDNFRRDFKVQCL